MLTVILAFQVARAVGISLNLAENSAKVSALFATIPNIFSLEALYSHGYVYWRQSLFQLFFMAFVLLSIRIGFCGRPMRLVSCSALALCVLLMCLTEWTGFLVAAGAPIALWLAHSVPPNTRRRYLITVFLAAAMSGAILLVWFSSSIGQEVLLAALFSRFKSRGVDSTATIGELLFSYKDSFGLFLVVAVIGLVSIGYTKGRRNMQLALFALAIALIAILENFLMKQHATTYHYDRLKFLLFFTVLVPFIWLIPGKLIKFATAGLIIVASGMALASYQTAKFFPDVPVQQNAAFIRVAKLDDAIITTPYQVRGAIALMFHQNVHQDVLIEQAAELALSKTTPVVSIDADMLENQSLRIHGFYRFNQLGNIEYFSRAHCNERPHSSEVFVVQSCNVVDDGLVKRTLVRYATPALSALDLASEKLQPFDLTDATWINGIARPTTGSVFFVPRSDLAINVYLRHTKELTVEFAGKDVRQVVAAYPTGGFINVIVDGLALPTGAAGSRNRLIIREKPENTSSHK